MVELPFKIFSELLKAWIKGTRRVRTLIVVSAILMSIGIPIFLISQNLFESPLGQIGRVGGLMVAGAGFVLAFIISAIQQIKERNQSEQKIEEVERRVQENPRETQAAWELARIVLEKYINRNLAQVRAIFWLTSFVMLAGFTLIGIGSYQGFHDPANFNASILTSVSGVVVSFIGGTFLILYRSVMAQAEPTSMSRQWTCWYTRSLRGLRARHTLTLVGVVWVSALSGHSTARMPVASAASFWPRWRSSDPRDGGCHAQGHTDGRF